MPWTWRSCLLLVVVALGLADCGRLGFAPLAFDAGSIDGGAQDASVATEDAGDASIAEKDAGAVVMEYRPSCGNGVFDPSLGETCDSSSPDTPCPVDCDDGNACTQDMQSGDANTCDAACDNRPITLPDDEDGCCPPDANSLSDMDCPPVCGNAVIEAGEECDGGSLCTPDCKNTDEARCLAFDTVATELCKECRCSQCAEPTLACVDNPDPGFASYCYAELECARKFSCYGEECYCGTSSNCWMSSNGPCKAEIDAAAAYQGVSAYDCYSDPMCASIYATDVGTCEMDRCSDECWR